MSNSSIWFIDKTLSGATTLDQSGPGSNVNEGVLHFPQGSSITGASPSDYLISYTGLSCCVEVIAFCSDAVGVFCMLIRLSNPTVSKNLQNISNDPIYQPLRSGRIWHKVNFLSGV